MILKLADEQLKLGVSVILDGVFGRQGFRDDLIQMASQYKVPFKPIFCHISDRESWKVRWHHRQSVDTSSHWMNPIWDDVLRIDSSFQAWECSDVLSLDAMNPTEQNFQRIKDYLKSEI